MSDQLWTVVISILSFVTGGGLLKLSDLIIKTWEKSRRERMPNVIEVVLEVYARMHAIQRACDAGQILIVRASNGGSKPHPAKPLYIIPMYETNSSIPPIIHAWGDKRQADEQYLMTIDDMLNNGNVYIEIDEMHSGIMRDQFLHDGIRAAQLFLIAITPDDNLLYMCISWDRLPPDDEQSAAKRRAVITAGIAKIQSLIDKIPM